MGSRELAKVAVPARVRRVLRRRIDEMRAIRAAPTTLERLETLMFESHEQIQARSRARWETAEPDVELTFRRALTGDAFVAKAVEHGAFAPGTTVLEIGPGYGRLLDAALRRGVAFDRWIGVDLSSRNVEHLRARFAAAPARFVAADAATVELEETCDLLVSSLTLKHMYPSFEPALANVARFLREGALLVFDLIEGRRRYFEDDAKTFIRWYEREEVGRILERVGCELAAFDRVEHDPDHHRLLVVARRGAAAAG